MIDWLIKKVIINCRLWKYIIKQNQLDIKFLAGCRKEEFAYYPPKLIIILISYLRIVVTSPLAYSAILFTNV